MSGKDDFTFDDNDAFPETDLSSAFEETEQQAPEEEPPPKKSRRKSAAKGSSRSRVLLLVLLLVVAAGAGAYYFMGLGGTSPEVVKAPPKAQKTVALPPKPAKAPAPEPDKSAAPSKPQQGGATVAVPPPPSAAPAPVEPAVQPPKAEAALQVKTDAQKTVVAVAPPATTAASAPVEQPQPVSPPPAKTTEAPAPVAVAKPEPAKLVTPPQEPLATGDFTLDAGSYLLQSNRLDVEKKLRALGYEPQVTPVEAKVAMFRLRLGTFPAGEAQEALAYAKKISPSAFSLFKDGQYAVYAGTFFERQNLETLRERFLLEGIKAEDEPVEVVRTLSRVRFGRFATSDEAATAAAKLAADGITATVVKFK